MFYFNKIGEDGRTGSAWKQGAGGEGEGVWGQGEEMALRIHTHMKKCIEN
jgi:hypothetical protein